MTLLVNVGCGTVAHTAWRNFDVVPQLEHVQALDVRRGLPLAEGVADATYSSHVLEHLTASEAQPFLAEMRRVLKPGGVIRLVVPDLEVICRNYLLQLDELRSGVATSGFAYRFTLLELFDQVVRDQSGGELIAAYRGAAGADQAYVLARHGAEARPHFKTQSPNPTAVSGTGKPSRRTMASTWARVRWRALLACCRIIGGESAVEKLRIGAFRQSGEIHRSMYDSHSLAALLAAQGFSDVRPVSAYDSAIPAFAQYGLDVVAGAVRKPDSLFVEARKSP